MPRSKYRSLCYRSWNVSDGVELWCSHASGWYVVFVSGEARCGIEGHFTWRVSRDQARVLFGLVRA